MYKAGLEDYEEQVPSLSNNKICLRKVETSDLAQLLAISYYDGALASTMADAEEMHHQIQKDIIKQNSIHWAIVEITNNKIVGTCGFYRGFSNGLGELGCVLLPQFQGNGFMTSALELAIEFGFNQLKLKQIWAATSIENLKAMKLLEKLNFKRCHEMKGEVRFELYPGLNTI